MKIDGATYGLGADAEKRMEDLAREAGRLWNVHRNRYGLSTASRPLWDIIREACRKAYVLGACDSDYLSGRALDSLTDQPK